MKKWLTLGVLATCLIGFVACQKDESTSKRQKKRTKSMAQSEQVLDLEIEAVNKQ